MFDFDELIDRRNTHSMKWDIMERLYGVSPEDGVPMWVADMDFRPPPAVNRALAQAVEHGVHGYFGDDRDYKTAITGWMARRHGWDPDPVSILTTHGIVQAVALCIQAFSQPGEGVIIFTPVYHAFARVIRANARAIVESPLLETDGRYRMDLDGLAAQLTGRERMVILSSPHNPGGRIWAADELRAVAGFCEAHDLLLISDEIHHDLLLHGNRHIPMPLAAPGIGNRLVVLTAATKTFNIAGALTGNLIVPDPRLRARLAARIAACGISPNRLGVLMATAAYEEGDAWVDALCAYLSTNARFFETELARIPGLRPMPLEATYLEWVDFAGTGMAPAEFTARVEQGARIAASHGPTFGSGGETFLRFNIATPRAHVEEAVRRLQAAFGDLQ